MHEYPLCSCVIVLMPNLELTIYILESVGSKAITSLLSLFARKAQKSRVSRDSACAALRKCKAGVVQVQTPATRPRLADDAREYQSLRWAGLTQIRVAIAITAEQ